LTPDDLQLDGDVFLNRKHLTLYRIARAKYANLSGLGAAMAPGRWNRLGQEAICTSTEVSVPILERLAHTTKDLIPSNLAMMKIRVSGNWEIHENAITDAQTGAVVWLHRDLAEAKRRFMVGSDLFAEAMNPFAVALPSVIVPVWNVVLFPKAPGFWQHVSLESVEAFEFDPRLFPESAAAESSEGTKLS
jgi:RES domain-containing protein